MFAGENWCLQVAGYCDLTHETSKRNLIYRNSVDRHRIHVYFSGVNEYGISRLLHQMDRHWSRMRRD